MEISLAEDGGQYSFTGDLKELLSDGEEAEFWYRTRYGFLLLRQDGTFSYKADAGNEAVQAAAGETCLLDNSRGLSTTQRRASGSAGRCASCWPPTEPAPRGTSASTP